MKMPDYRTIEDCVLKGDFFSDSKTLPAGSYVKPIDWYWLPAHIKEQYKHYDRHTMLICYTRYGIFPIPKAIVEEA